MSERIRDILAFLAQERTEELRRLELRGHSYRGVSEAMGVCRGKRGAEGGGR